MLDFFQYDGTADAQSPSTINGIRIIVCVMPMIAVIICIIILSLYPLKGDRFTQLCIELAKIYGEDMLENEDIIAEFRKHQEITCDTPDTSRDNENQKVVRR